MNKQRTKMWCLKQLLLIAGLCLGFIASFHLHTAIASDTDGGSQETGETGDDGRGDTDDPGDADDPGDSDTPGDTDDPGDGDETPSYANPAQAQHAANLATAAASQPDEETEGALSAVEEAEAALAEAEQSGTPEDIEAAKENLAQAQGAYDDLVAEKTGLLSQEISDMREEGMGWGEIAHELGVHPGLLGLGHTKKGKDAYGQVDMDEMSEATARNTKSGWSKGHGVGLNAGVESAGGAKGGYAYGLGKSAKSGKKGGKGGFSGASGLGGKGGASGGGHGGGSGNGNGKGAASSDGSPGNSGKGGGKGGSSGKGNKGGNSGGNGKGGGKGK